MGYESSYTGREIDAAVKRVREDIPTQLDNIEKNITNLSNQKADTKIVPRKNSQLENDSNFMTQQQIEELLGKNSPVDSGIKCVSGNDNLTEIVPGEGEPYIIKYANMPARDADGNTVITGAVRFRIKVGDGKTNLAKLPVISGIETGASPGSVVLVDPTYNNGKDKESSISTAEGQYGVSLGKYLKNDAASAAAFNYNNTITKLGERSFVINQNNIVNAENAFVGGYKNTANGDGGAVLGGNNVDNGYQDIILGILNKTGENAKYVGLMGRGLFSNSSHRLGQIILGSYNEEDNEARVVLASGLGSAERRNSIVVKHNGNINLKGGEITLEGVVKFNNDSFTINEDNSITIGSTKITEEQLVDLLSIPDNISSALDELHAYAEALVGGAE